MRWGRAIALLGAGLQVEVDDVAFIEFDAGSILHDHLRGGFGDARVHGPRPGENVGIFEGGLIADGFAFAGDAFDDVERGAVEPSVEAEPGVVVEISSVHDEGVSLPMSDGVSIVARVCIGVVRAAVGGYEAKRVSRDYLIEEYDGHSGSLNDGVWRSDTRNASGFAEERRVQFALVAGEVFDFFDPLRLVGRLVGVGE